MATRPGGGRRHRPHPRGFSLIELMFAIVLLGILVALAAPSFTTYQRNAQVRSTTSAIENGLRVARAEALRRSRTVVFFLTTAAPAAGATAAANGPNWVVETVPLVGGETAEMVQGARWADLAPLATVTGPAAVCFGPLGTMVTVTASARTARGINCNATTVPVYDIAATGSDRPLRVLVNGSGQARWCDPVRTLSATNPDGC